MPPRHDSLLRKFMGACLDSFLVNLGISGIKSVVMDSFTHGKIFTPNCVFRKIGAWILALGTQFWRKQAFEAPQNTDCTNNIGKLIKVKKFKFPYVF